MANNHESLTPFLQEDPLPLDSFFVQLKSALLSLRCPFKFYFSLCSLPPKYLNCPTPLYLSLKDQKKNHEPLAHSFERLKLPPFPHFPLRLYLNCSHTHTHTHHSLTHTLPKIKAFHSSTQRAMGFLFPFYFSNYSYTTPPLLLDKSRESKEVHPLVATKLAN